MKDKNSIRKFHAAICQRADVGSQVGPLCKWTICQIANMDQTPTHFMFAFGGGGGGGGGKHTLTWVTGVCIYVHGGALDLEKGNALFS